MVTKEVAIRDIQVGQAAWTVPWAVYEDAGRELVLDVVLLADPYGEGMRNLLVVRREDGYWIDTRKLRRENGEEYKWGRVRRENGESNRRSAIAPVVGVIKEDTK